MEYFSAEPEIQDLFFSPDGQRLTFALPDGRDRYPVRCAWEFNSDKRDFFSGAYDGFRQSLSFAPSAGLNYMYPGFSQGQLVGPQFREIPFKYERDISFLKWLDADSLLVGTHVPPYYRVGFYLHELDGGRSQGLTGTYSSKTHWHYSYLQEIPGSPVHLFYSYADPYELLAIDLEKIETRSLLETGPDGSWLRDLSRAGIGLWNPESGALRVWRYPIEPDSPPDQEILLPGVPGRSIPYILDLESEHCWFLTDPDGHGNQLHRFHIESGTVQRAAAFQGVDIFGYTPTDPNISAPTYLRHSMETLHYRPEDGSTLGFRTHAFSTRDFFWDAEMREIQGLLFSRFPGKQVILVSSSDDGDRLAFLAFADEDPGTYVTFEKKSQRLKIFGDVRPALKDVPLASVRRFPVSLELAPGDRRQSYAYLTVLPGDENDRPLVILFRDQPRHPVLERFYPFPQFLASRGFAVLEYDMILDRTDGLFQANARDLPQVLAALEKQVPELQTASWIVIGDGRGGPIALDTAMRFPLKTRGVAAFDCFLDAEDIDPRPTLYQEKTGEKFIYTHHRNAGFTNADFQSMRYQRYAELLSAPVLLSRGEWSYSVPENQYNIFRRSIDPKAAPLTFVEVNERFNSVADAEARHQVWNTLERFLKDL